MIKITNGPLSSPITLCSIPPEPFCLPRTSHYCLVVAMRALCIKTRLLPGSLIEALGKGKRLREDADYYDR